MAIPRTHYAYDAFPTKARAKALTADLRKIDPSCGAIMRKLRTPEDGGRLRYGVYVKKSCRL